jgi:hypothetical protein
MSERYKIKPHSVSRGASVYFPLHSMTPTSGPSQTTDTAPTSGDAPSQTADSNKASGSPIHIYCSNADMYS